MDISRSDTPPRGVAYLPILVAALLAIGSLVIREFLEADVWWQVAIGRDILATLSVPKVDHYAVAAFGRNYHDSHWLFQVLLAAADRAGGMTAVGTVPVLLWGATFVSCYRSMRRWASPALGATLLFLVALACSYRFMPRPELVTCLMVALFYQLLQKGRYLSGGELALLALLQVLWSNAHGLFVLGPFLGGCYLLDALWRVKRGQAAGVRPELKLLVVLFGATLVTPFGVDGWLYAAQLAQEAGSSAHPLYQNLAELKPTFSAHMLGQPDFWAFALLALLGAGAAIAAWRREELHPGRALVVVALFLVASGARRNIPLFALTAAPFIAEQARCLGLLPGNRTLLRSAAALALTLFCWLPLSGRYYSWFGYDPLRFGVGAPERYLPAGLPGFLRQTGFSGRIFNSDLYGGYLMYHGIPPLIDGRWEVYDINTLQKILSAPFDRALWEWVVATYRIEGILLEAGSADARSLVPHLIAEGKFTQVYADAVSTFWVRNRP